MAPPGAVSTRMVCARAEGATATPASSRNRNAGARPEWVRHEGLLREAARRFYAPHLRTVSEDGRYLSHCDTTSQLGGTGVHVGFRVANELIVVRGARGHRSLPEPLQEEAKRDEESARVLGVLGYPIGQQAQRVGTIPGHRIGDSHPAQEVLVVRPSGEALLQRRRGPLAVT